LFYGKDAFEGLATMDKLMELKRLGADDGAFGLVPEGREGARPRAARAAAGSSGAPAPADQPARAPSVALDNPIFIPPFVGSRLEKGIPLDDIAAYLNQTALFRGQWGYRPDKSIGESDADFKQRISGVLREQLGAVRSSDILQPAVAYGWFAVNGEGDDLIVWKDDSRTAEWLRFTFPRQPTDPWLSIADFFRSSASGDADYAAFHIVTMGPKVSEETARLFAENHYQDYLHLHGLGVEMTEALAEYWHHRIRSDWGFAGEDGPTLGGLFRQQYRGGRYSWGYPACPDLEDNAKCAELLSAERIGVEVSEETSWQFHPEQTTAAIICHHPQAKYFVVDRP
jgi:5-methyltetrahydrofolate--homocysteine methyltransferase